MTNFRTFDSRDALMQTTAELIAKALNDALLQRGEAFAALSGGTTPAPAYERLATMAIDWPRVTFLVIDERFVPPSHEASNEALLRRALAPALTANAKLLPLYSDVATLDAAAARADALYAGRPIDIALLGMGGDGHTASWFPNTPSFRTAMASTSTVISVDAPGAYGTPERLTLTRNALMRARSIALLITSPEKRALLQAKPRPRLPVDELFDLGVPIETLWAP